MKKNNFLLISGIVLIALGLWIALIPFSRPLPGGEIFSFESTPAASCKSPILSAFNNDLLSYEVYVNPKPKIGDPTIYKSLDCSERATFRLAMGLFFLLLGLSAVIYLLKTRNRDE